MADLANIKTGGLIKESVMDKIFDLSKYFIALPIWWARVPTGTSVLIGSSIS